MGDTSVPSNPAPRSPRFAPPNPQLSSGPCPDGQEPLGDLLTGELIGCYDLPEDFNDPTTTDDTYAPAPQPEPEQSNWWDGTIYELLGKLFGTL